MKKVLLFITFLVVIFGVPFGASAATCDYSEQNRLNGIGANVKTDYAIKTRTVKENVSSDEDPNLVVEFDYYYFTINIYNVTNEMKVNVINKSTSYSTTYYFTDAKDGIISFDSYEINTTVEFEIQILSYNTEDCNDILLSTKTVRLPRSNRFSNYEICKEAEGFYLCQDFLTSDYDISEFNFFNRVQEYLKTISKDKNEDPNDEETTNLWLKIFDFAGRYWYYFASGVIVIGLGAGVIVAIRVRRRDI